MTIKGIVLEVGALADIPPAEPGGIVWLSAAVGWQPIETAPKGGGAEMVTDPNWVEPPRVLLLCADGTQVVARWDWYYAEGGRGCTDGCAWIEPTSSEQVNMSYGEPTHWMPLPPQPTA